MEKIWKKVFGYFYVKLIIGLWDLSNLQNVDDNGKATGFFVLHVTN